MSGLKKTKIFINGEYIGSFKAKPELPPLKGCTIKGVPHHPFYLNTEEEWLPLKGCCAVRKDEAKLKEWEAIYRDREDYDQAAMCRDYLKKYFPNG